MLDFILEWKKKKEAMDKLQLPRVPELHLSIQQTFLDSTKHKTLCLEWEKMQRRYTCPFIQYASCKKHLLQVFYSLDVSRITDFSYFIQEWSIFNNLDNNSNYLL